MFLSTMGVLTCVLTQNSNETKKQLFFVTYTFMHGAKSWFLKKRNKFSQDKNRSNRIFNVHFLQTGVHDAQTVSLTIRQLNLSSLPNQLR